MPDEAPVAEVHEIAGSSGPLLDRARELVEALERWLPAETVWLTLSYPDSQVYATVGSTGLERSVLDYLARPAVGGRQHSGFHRGATTVRVTELPVPVDELPTWAECLIPAGFRGGVGVPLLEPGGCHVGLLSVLFSGTERPSAVLRDQLEQLAPVIARGVSPLRSLLATARLAQGASSGSVLLRDGRSYPLPGLADHRPWSDASLVTDIARRALLAGQVYRSFMWPSADPPGSSGYARVTILAATDVPAFVLGTVLVTPDAECHGLTPRELEVLGLLVAGCSNQQIARRLAITPRTVAAHVEHILHKLHVPTRTEAAVRAEREGCYVPQRPRPRQHPT